MVEIPGAVLVEVHGVGEGVEDVARFEDDVAEGSEEDDGEDVAVEGGEDADGAAGVEGEKGNGAMAGGFLEQKSGDEKAGDEKEDADAVVTDMPRRE